MQKIAIGSRWLAKHAHRRIGAYIWTVKGNSKGVYITSLESRSPGYLFSTEEFLKLYEPVN